MVQTAQPISAPSLVPVDPEAVRDAQILAELEFQDEVLTWLATLPVAKPERVLIWRNQEETLIPVEDIESLTMLIVGMMTHGGYGVLTTPENPVLCSQIGENDGGAQVDVQGGEFKHYVGRIFVRGAGSEANSAKPRRNAPWDVIYDDEVFRSASAAAHVMWEWMHNKLADGYGIRSIEPIGYDPNPKPTNSSWSNWDEMPF